MSTLTVGLTGGLASGKSTVAEWLREAGCEVIDADELVADLYRPGGAGSQVVRGQFGPAALRDDGSVDRRAVARLVFADPEARQRLERAIHPLVRERFVEIAEACEGIAVLEASLLLEAGFAPAFDLLITVEADPETRIRRAVDRGLSETEARARLAAQGSEEARRAAADVVIDNDGSLRDLRRRVDEVVEQVLRPAADVGRGLDDDE